MSFQYSQLTNAIPLQSLHSRKRAARVESTSEERDGFENEIDHNNTSLEEATDPRKNAGLQPSSFQRIGKWRTAILVLSFVFIIGALSFLGWLWTSGSSNSNWVRIVKAGWLTRSVTIAAIALRTATSSQAMVAISMLAALYLETRGVRLKDAAEMSIIRNSNSASLQNLWRFWRNSSGLSGIPFFALAFLLVLLTAVLQFSSTILLTDVAEGLLLGSNATHSSFTGLIDDGPIKNVNYWTVTPSVFANFIEYTEPAVQQDSVVDTGVSIRGFLPISNQSSRAAVRAYDGMAALFDTRVICSRPNILFDVVQMNSSVESASGNRATHLYLLELKGTMTTNLTLPGVFNSSDIPADFDCFIAGTAGRTTYLCELLFQSNEADQGLNSRLAPVGYDQNLGNSYLLWDIPETCTYPGSNDCRLNEVKSASAQTGPWQSFSVSNSSSDSDMLRVSVCYDALQPVPHDYNISVVIPETPPSEPAARVVVNSSNTVVDTSSIIQQLGVSQNDTQPSAKERGIIELKNFETIDQQRQTIGYRNATSNSSNVFTTPTTPFIWTNIYDSVPDAGLTLFLNTDIPLGAPQTADTNVVLIKMFLDTMEATQNPALALQAIFTTILRTAYYDAVPFFDYEQPVQTRSATSAQIPRATAGFIAVATLVLVHWLLTMLTFIIFMFKGRYAVLNKAWAAVLEVCTAESEALLGQGANRAKIMFESDIDGEMPLMDKLVKLKGLDTV